MPAETTGERSAERHSQRQGERQGDRPADRQTDRPGRRTTVNGIPADLGSGETIASVVAGWCESGRGVAVARNGEVVPKSRWNSVEVLEGDSIEILTAAAWG
jgi:sulfur carrier protein